MPKAIRTEEAVAIESLPYPRHASVWPGKEVAYLAEPAVVGKVERAVRDLYGRKVQVEGEVFALASGEVIPVYRREWPSGNRQDAFGPLGAPKKGK